MVLILTQLPRVIHLVFSNASFGSSPMFFSSSVSLPPPLIQPPFALVSSVREGGKISRKEEKQVKSQHATNAELTAYSLEKQSPDFPGFDAGYF